MEINGRITAMKKRIRKTICDRSGSYITEAAVFLPVLIISCAL